MEQETASVYRSRHLYLLVSLVLLILLTPLVEGLPNGHFAVDALYSLILLAAVNAVSTRRQTRLIALAVAILAIVLLWTNTGEALTLGRQAGILLFVAFNAVTIGLVLRHVVRAPAVTFDVLCAGIAIYLLIGVTWAVTYIVLDTLDPNAFKTLSASIDAGSGEFLYFSFATLTTLGYGDVVPHSLFTRTWAIMEAVTGVLYIAILVARLVSLYRS
jgi:hypothetical protein